MPIFQIHPENPARLTALGGRISQYKSFDTNTCMLFKSFRLSGKKDNSGKSNSGLPSYMWRVAWQF